MTLKKKLLLAFTGLFLIAIVSGVLYAKNIINNPLEEPISQQPALKNITNKNISDDKIISDDKTVNTVETVSTTASTDNAIAPKNTAEQQTDSPAPAVVKDTVPATPTPVTSAPANKEIANTVQQEIGAPVETTDILKAGFILVKKLSKDEINFLFGFSDKSYTVEELEKVRSLLLSKLSAEEVNTLRALGAKYGKKLEILDPNVPIIH